jgi:GT2 family glycosyltransferase
MKPNLTFSIITPNLNQGRFLSQNISSVFKQNSLVQHFLLDGASSDDSLEVIDKFKSKLHFFSSGKDNGQSQAINKGLKLATGQIITWLNSDDYYLPYSLDLVTQAFLSNPEIDVVYGSAILVDASDLRLGVDHGQKHGLPYRYFAGMCFPQPASFFRASVLAKVGFLSENLHYGMDYEFFLRIKLKQYSFKRLNTPIAAYRLHNCSKTVSSPLHFANEWIQIYNNFLHGESNSKPIFYILNRLNLYRDQTSHYPRDHSLNLEDLKQTLLYALHYQAYFRYQSNQYSIVRKIIRVILTEFPFTRLTLPMFHMHISSKLKHIQSI